MTDWGVSVAVLGDLTAWVDGQPVDLGGRRQRAVLALLVVARGEFVPTERIIDAVWPAERPADPVASLQTFVSKLRRSLQPQTSARERGAVIVSGRAGYALRLEPDAVDSWRFERVVADAIRLLPTDPDRAAELLGEALALWRGRALAEYADEDWAGPEIGRLSELRSVAREQLLAARDRLLAEVDAELLLRAGRPAEALVRLNEVATRVPQVINPAWRRDRLLWCLAAAECGEARAARDEAEKLLGLARQWGAAGAVGEALVVLGRLRGTDGVDVLREAVDVLAASPRRIVHAEALTALGGALASRENASERAIDPLHEAHAIALRTGALRVAEEARAVLAAHHLPQPQSVEHHNGRLTSIQQRILQLVDAGAGVQEIGQALFLTPSTVQHHLDEARRRSAAR